MRPTVELDVKHKGTLGGERKSFSVDVSSQAAVAHLMSILTDLYSDPAGAAIREVATNAQDSHKAKGQTRPIEVTLPTDIDPTFTVKDFGVGLTPDELLDHYSQFLWSSKRENDDETGMLGLGCKAPLTYTSQFTVTATKGGVRASVLVSRGTDGVGGLEVVDTRSTKDPDGVEVVIPVVNHREAFIEKAMHFFGFWSEGSVLVNGEEPPKHMENEDARRLDPDVVLTPHLRHDYIVMGNVPYPCGERITGYDMDGHAIVRVPVGSVNFVPSREALHYTPRTEDAVASARDFVLESFRRIAQTDIDEQPSATKGLEAMDKWVKLHRGLRGKLTFRGNKPPYSVEMDDWGYSYNPYHDSSSKFKEDASVPLVTLQKSVFVLGYTNKTFTRIHKEKLKKFLTDRDGDIEKGVYLFGEKLPEPYWLDEVEVIDWSTIEGIKIAPDRNRPKRKPVRWEMVTGQSSIEEQTDPDLTGKVIYITGQGMYSDARYAANAFPGEKIVLLHPNRVDKFTREVKGAIEIYAAAKVAKRRFLRDLEPEHLEAMGSPSKELRAIDGIEVEKVLDPKLRLFIERMRDVDRKGIRVRMSGLNHFLSWGQRIEIPARAARMQKYVTTTYPLLSALDYYARADDVLAYVNALHLTRQERTQP